MREWQYWTRNKLEIPAGYLPAVNVAAKRSPERLYVDLMAGQPVNRERLTGEEFDGSPGVADLAAQHGNSRGKVVHFTATSVRYLRLDRAQRARRT